MKSTERARKMAAKRAEREAHAARMAAIHAESAAIVATGKCPQCGAALHRNTSLAGWWQCDRSGSGHFRRDQTGQHCSFQCFTE
jgi:hypothetical protein